jgi:hypothetical protein
MPQANNSASVQLLKLEKLAKKIIRKSLKNNTLDYTVQISVSSLEPNKVKYSTMISSPASGVQPILFTYDSFALLEAALETAVKSYNPRAIEIAYHENRINTHKAKAEQHEKRKAQLEDPNFEDEDIEMEEA